MKKLLIITALVLFAGVAFGQTMQKGSVIGLHTSVVTLNAGVTLDQYMDFINNTLFPEWEKHFPGIKLYLVRGLNREVKDEYALIFFAESKEVYNKYWNDDGSNTDETVAAISKVQPVIDEWNKLDSSTHVITDWVVQ
jgi:hypothetical protein